MNLLNYTLRQADSTLILGQRLAEWCGHGPVLEQDIALTNISLDLIGQARSLYQYAAELEGKGRSEDDLAFHRDVREFYNLLLVELPKGNFGDTIARQFFFDAFNYFFYQEFQQSKDERLSAIAEKSIKEVSYHLRFSSEWMIRLGDGTDVSHVKMQQAVDDVWMYTGEMFVADELDREMLTAGIGVDLEKIRPQWEARVASILDQATLQQPADSWMQSGGKQGIHTEHLGFILAEMQHLQRAHPGAEW